MITDVVRTQIQLTDTQARELKSLAASEGRSMADIIREAVDSALAVRGRVDREAVKRRSLAALGRFDSGLTDVSTNHDEYFAEAIES